MLITILTFLNTMAFSADLDCDDACQQLKVEATLEAMVRYSHALENYRRDCQRHPSTEQGLQSLKTRPVDEPLCENWDPRHSMNELPKDAWGRALIYESDTNGYRLISLGADRREGGREFASDVRLGFGEFQ